MKTLRPRFLLLVALLAVGFVSAQDPVPASQPFRTPQKLEQLVAPIALYPDALIALILPAATAPTDIVLAARHVRENPGDRTQIEHRAWDESVKSLASYPEIVVWMDENLTWTKQVGEAFAAQPADMMQAVQRLRAQARAAGTLVDTPQQQVLAEPNVIRIVPAQPDIIYVPYYDPAAIFVDRPSYYSYPRPFVSFGYGVAIGSWLAFDCDWRRNVIWVGNRHRVWRGHDWRQPVVSYAPAAPSPGLQVPVVRQWRPAPSSLRPGLSVSTNRRSEVAQPAPISNVVGRVGDSRGGSLHFRSQPNNAVTPATPGATLPQRPYSGNSRTGFTGPTAPTAVVAPPLPSARIAAPLAQTVPTPPPSVTSRRSTPDPTRENENRSRGGSDATRENDGRNRGGYRAIPQGTPVSNAAIPASSPTISAPAPAANYPAPRAHTRQTAPTYTPQGRSVVSSPPPPPAPAASTAPAPTVSSPAPAKSSAPAQSAPAPDRRGGRRDDKER